MSWASSSSYSPTVSRKPTTSNVTASASTPTGSSANSTEEGAGGGPVRTTDQASGDLIVPLVIWNDPPRLEISCLHVLHLPMSQPSQNTGDLMNRWPSLASFVQQWSSSQQNLQGSLGSFPSLNSTHSMINLKRVLSRQKSKRGSLSAEERAAIAAASLDDDDYQYVDDGDIDGDDELYQLCVFGGTVDGKIIFWLLEQDVVVQVSLLVHPTAASVVSDYRDDLTAGGSSTTQGASPIVSIVTGVDEWGQSNMLSVSRDGAVARWELPNGACSKAEVNLARQLAPVKGMEMFCNNRYAIVYGEQSRMMVLDTWKLQLMYCVDTAQEQVRRGIAIVELRMSSSSALARRTTAASAAGTDSPSRRISDVTASSNESSVSSYSNFVGTSSFSQTASSSPSSTTASLAGASSAAIASTRRSIAGQIWDSLVISLGSEGLVKCFLWSKPRGGSSSATSVGSGATWGSYQWVQESCWVISWADDADDITCSQSTSLKDGDNMNPQTALMRSIKSSYFPRCLHISSDASLLLFVWDNKWVILKRKWLCDTSPPGTSIASRTTNRSASWKSGTGPTSKTKTKKYVGSCRIHPAQFLGRPGVRMRGESDERGTRANDDVWWENGTFLDDEHIVLWTNTGHAFQFPVHGNSLTQAGKLFVFKKDQDQLVPRSYHKSLNAVRTGELIAFFRQCECCQGDRVPPGSFRTEKLRRHVGERNANRMQGFTARASTSEGASRSYFSTSPSSLRMVHMCQKGSVGSWSLSATNTPENGPPPSPSRVRRGSLSNGNYERVKMHSVSDGFVGDLPGTPTLPPDPTTSSGSDDTTTVVTHLILGREDSRSSSSIGDSSTWIKRQRRRRVGKIGAEATSSSRTSSGTLTSSAIANALGPVSALLPASMTRFRRASIGGVPVSSEDVYSEYLLDVPVVVKGFNDGSLEFQLLASAKASSKSSHSVQVTCHRSKVNAVAHCCWLPPTNTQLSSDQGPPTITRATTTGSAPSSSNSNGVPYVSARKAQVSKRGAPMEDSSLVSDKNPFYRARFPPPAQRRSMSSRHMSIHHSPPIHPNPNSASTAPPAAPVSMKDESEPSLNFMVFSGCADGVLRISELTLRSGENSSFDLTVKPLQRFKKHRGAIKEVLISPWTRENTICPERFVATIGEDNTVNVYAPVYLQNPYAHGASSMLSQTATGRPTSKSGIEWECVMEFCEHPDSIRSLEWLTDRGQIIVECDDGMVYVWSLDTGVLERSLPAAVMYDGGNSVLDQAANASDKEAEASSVECSKLTIGDSAVHLIKFSVNKSAEVIKTNWKAYYHALLSAEDSDGVNKPKPWSMSGSPYAVGSIELLLLAFLLSWRASPDIDRACRDLLGLDSPNALFSCVLLDEESGALSIPLPWKSVFSPLSKNTKDDRNPFARKWQHSSALSANVALGIVSLCMNLMEHKYSKADDNNVESTAPLPPSSPKNKEEFHVLWSQLITQHSVVLPDYVPFFREPSLEFLAKYGFHPCEYTQLAARALLNSAIKRLHPSSRSALCAEYSAKLHCEIVRLETETGGKLNGTVSSHSVDSALTVTRLGSLVILLSMIGTCYPGEISPAGAREVCDILVSLLRAPMQHVASVAAELLTKGLMLFRPHLVDLSSLITQLLFIDLREKQRNPGGDSPTFGSNARVLASGGSNAALSLLVELGACESAFVLTLLQQEMNNAERPHAFRECILLYLTELVNTHYLLMFRHLPSVIDTIMCCLDPTKPERRKRCLELSTRCLHNLVRRFPMIDFHRETQRLAIGTMEAVIVIYDLRTATKWRVLDGHSSAISAVGFRGDGQIIVSYAAREGSVRWWNSGNAGLFGGMLKMQQACIKEHKLDVLKSFAHAPSSSGGASGDLKQVIQTCRFQFLVLKEGQAGNNQQGERKVLRLTREDASQVQFLM